MHEGTQDPVSIGIIFATIAYFFALLILANVQYTRFLRLMRKIQPEYEEDLGGLFAGEGGKFIWGFGEYWFRSPLYIHVQSTDQAILATIQSHNRVIKVFWISVFTLLPAVILFLNIRGK